MKLSEASVKLAELAKEQPELGVLVKFLEKSNRSILR